MCRNAFNPQPNGILNNLYLPFISIGGFPRAWYQDGEKEQLWSKCSGAGVYVAVGDVFAYGTCHPTRIIKGECLNKFNAVHLHDVNL